MAMPAASMRGMCAVRWCCAHTPLEALKGIFSDDARAEPCGTLLRDNEDEKRYSVSG